MKILVFCPTYHNEPDSLASIMALDTGDHDVHLLMTRTQRCDVGSYNILYNYRQGRAAMLASDYDAMMTVEDDMVIPRAALVKLAAIDADITCGLYVNRHRIFNRYIYVATKSEPDTNEPIDAINEMPGFVAAHWGQQIPISSGGFGCTLIRRHVLEAVQLRLMILRDKYLLADCDTWFFHDAGKAGYRTTLDMSVICGHISNGAIYWPTPTGGVRTTLTNTTRQLLEAA